MCRKVLEGVCTHVTSSAASRDSAVKLMTDSYQFWVAHYNLRVTFQSHIRFARKVQRYGDAFQSPLVYVLKKIILWKQRIHQRTETKFLIKLSGNAHEEAAKRRKYLSKCSSWGTSKPNIHPLEERGKVAFKTKISRDRRCFECLRILWSIRSTSKRMACPAFVKRCYRCHKIDNFVVACRIKLQ